MIHLAFEFSPGRQPLSGSSDLLSLLLAPMLRPRNTDEAPWIELLPRQHAGVTKASAERCLEFLEPTEIIEVGPSIARLISAQPIKHGFNVQSWASCDRIVDARGLG